MCRVLDFSSSSGGRVEVTSLIADGICLANAASLINFEEFGDRLQVQICEHCGFAHCEPGGWITLRRLGFAVLWVPCFDAMAVDAFAAGEYQPPRHAKGLPMLSADTYEQLRTRVPGFPAIAALPSLRSRDAVRLLQFNAPGRILGRFPDPPRLRRDVVLASDLGEADRAVDALEGTVSAAWVNDCLLHEVESARAISFYLDLRGTPEWSPIADESGVFSLCSRGGPFVSA